MRMFIVCKQGPDGCLTTSTRPHLHTDKTGAILEAERLMGAVTDATAFIVFEAVALSRRIKPVIETIDFRELPPQDADRLVRPF